MWKDCHVLTFTSTGSVADHLVLHPALETGNFIIKVSFVYVTVVATWIVSSFGDKISCTALHLQSYTADDEHSLVAAVVD